MLKGNCDHRNQCKPLTFIKKNKYTEKHKTKIIKLFRIENFHTNVNESFSCLYRNRINTVFKIQIKTAEIPIIESNRKKSHKGVAISKRNNFSIRLFFSLLYVG